jgi:hypothetical protein
MKLSVSVPDDLWEKAVRQAVGESPSGIIQKALSQFVGSSARSEYAVRPPLDTALAKELRAARAQIIDSAREMYQSGYRDGISLAKELGFSELAYIVEQGSLKAARTMAKFASEIAVGHSVAPPGARPLIEPSILVPYLGSYADFTHGGVEWTPTAPTVEGIDRALADVWEQVNSPVDGGEDARQPHVVSAKADH